MIRKWIFRAVIVVVLLAVLVAAAAYFYPEKLLCVDSGRVSADVIVVLGGGFGSHERPRRAVELFREQAAPCIIVTGFGDDEINRRLLLQAGIPATAIQVEGKSRTTRENAEFTIKLLRERNLRRVIIVTSWYHSRRALACFEHYAPEIQFYSRPAYSGFKQAGRKNIDMNSHIYSEFLKLPGYWICYGVRPF
jgi:uncharacterized SAM-binding protein YcdF (DUF218 family)